MKIIDLIKEQTFLSYEFFPPKTEKGVENLHKRMDGLKETEPLFVDFTWGAGGTTAGLTVELSEAAKKKGFEPNMHLTCTNMDKSLVDEALKKCQAAEIQNIVALRGDPPAGQEAWTPTDDDFTCALDLVKHIRKHYGNYFGISVAGYPEGHPNRITEVSEEEELTLTSTERSRMYTSPEGKKFACRDDAYEEEIKYLKSKVDAGADFIITQMFFDINVFIYFVQKCREAGILCPIVPGIMCIQNYDGFHRMVNFCKCRAPDNLKAGLEAVKADAAEVTKYGIQFGTDLCRGLIESKLVPGIHFYTLNQDKIVLPIRQNLIDQGLVQFSN